MFMAFHSTRELKSMLLIPAVSLVLLGIVVAISVG
jgi:hypothetical protein